MSRDVSLPTLSKEVASRLTTQFNGRFTCRHNSNVVYSLEKLTELRVDCWPQALERPKTNQRANNRLPTISLAIQQRAPTQEQMDLLTDLADDVLDWLIKSGRWSGGAYYCTDGAFNGASIFDSYSKYEENVFRVVMQINFRDFV
jgi:hypothetical protein